MAYFSNCEMTSTTIPMSTTCKKKRGQSSKHPRQSRLTSKSEFVSVSSEPSMYVSLTKKGITEERGESFCPLSSSGKVGVENGALSVRVCVAWVSATEERLNAHWPRAISDQDRRWIRSLWKTKVKILKVENNLRCQNSLINLNLNDTCDLSLWRK